jgi:hypothetical protein
VKPRSTALTGLLLLAACRASPPASVASAPLVQAPPFEPLEYVPAAGLRWLVDAHPARIFADSALAAAAGAVVARDRLDAFATMTGIDLRRLEEVVVGGYDLGTLYVTALPAADGGRARARFAERLSEDAIVKHPRPALYRISGTREGEPRALVSVGDRLLAVAIGDLTLSRIAEAYAERRLRSPTALRGAGLSELPPAPADAVAVLYAPGPFVDSWATVAGGLLRTALALHVAVRRGDSGALSVTLTAVGDWPADETGSRMDSAWREISRSSTGRLFGLDQAKNVRSVANLHQLTWSADLDISSLVAGLRAATTANVSEMFDVHGVEPTGSPADSQPADEPSPRP